MIRIAQRLTTETMKSRLHRGASSLSIQRRAQRLKQRNTQESSPSAHNICVLLSIFEHAKVLQRKTENTAALAFSMCPEDQHPYFFFFFGFHIFYNLWASPLSWIRFKWSSHLNGSFGCGNSYCTCTSLMNLPFFNKLNIPSNMTHHVPPVCLWRQVQSLSFSHTHTHTNKHALHSIICVSLPASWLLISFIHLFASFVSTRVSSRHLSLPSEFLRSDPRFAFLFASLFQVSFLFV